MLARETTGGKETSSCGDCSVELKLGVQESANGYWLGYWCDCGPAGRETEYLGSRQEAEDILESFYADGELRKKRY